MTPTNLKAIIPITLGTAIEWAEYTFFAYMVDLLSKQFFPIDDPEIAQLKTYGVFATSYFMRPLGALLFGLIGDKIGRKPALMGSMLLMCFATTTIGFLPTHTHWESLIAILLTICRLLQGLAVAGEFHGAAIFILEHRQSRPFFTGCLTPFAASVGMSIGAFAAMLVSLPNAPDFAWRIPFLASGFLGLVALYLRRNVSETPVFQQTITQKNTDSSNYQENSPAWASTAAMALFISVFIYVGNIYYKTLTIKIGGMNTQTAAQIITFGQVLAAFLIFNFGARADYLNGKKMCLMGLGTAIFLGPVMVACARSGNILYSMVGQIFYAIINGMVSATFMTLLVKQFRPTIRYTGNSLAWSIPSAIFGGTALMVADTLTNRFGFIGPGLYISLASLVAFLTILNPFSILSKLKFSYRSLPPFPEESLKGNPEN